MSLDLNCQTVLRIYAVPLEDHTRESVIMQQFWPLKIAIKNLESELILEHCTRQCTSDISNNMFRKSECIQLSPERTEIRIKFNIAVLVPMTVLFEETWPLLSTNEGTSQLMLPEIHHAPIFLVL